jgi:hypothetical protein
MDKVKRWDVYDAADYLDDVGWLLTKAMREDDWALVLEVRALVHEWVEVLYSAAKVAGTVGPSPEYKQEA